MKVLAIDPGPEKSACVVFDGKIVKQAEILPNQDILRSFCFVNEYIYTSIAIEMVACYGMAVGKEVFETCLWIGRFIERSPVEPQLIYRKDVKMHLCHNMRAKDTNLRQAILDRFGGKDKAIGLKRSPGPLYSVKSHAWAALAIALLVADTATQTNGK